MTSTKQFQLIMRDMLFITWEVNPESVRNLVDSRLELDTVTGSRGRPVALVSAVCFRVADVHSTTLLLPSLSFDQVNYRVYVRAGDIPAVCFLDIKVNSRMVAAITGFMSVPVHYEDIDIKTSPGQGGLLSYKVKSAGVRAEVMVGDQVASVGGISPDFITARFVGFVRVGDGMFKVEVDQPGLQTVSGSIQSVAAPGLEGLGVLTPEQSTRPRSVLYVREAPFGASTPTRLS
jgi:uncharacterized protein YqjF (DUF2071 family)